MRTMRVLPILAALALLGAAACTENRTTSSTTQPASNSTAPLAAQQTETATQQGRTTPLQNRAQAQAATGASGALLNPADVVKNVTPSVVRIRAGGTVASPFGGIGRAEGDGTGFIVDAKGYIVTNNHVVTLDGTRSVSSLSVDLWDGRTVKGTIVGRDERTDLAVIKIDADNLTPLRFADPATIQVGDEVLAIGFALDLGSTPTVTKGVISAKDRQIEQRISGALQTDAAINPGNSGGPLVNLRGEVVGVNTAGLFGAGGQPVQGIFFAISSQVAQPIVESLIKNGAVQRGYMGVSLQNVDKQEAQTRSFGVDEGAVVMRVESGSAAEKAGIRTGDVITKVGDQPIKNVGDVSNALTKYPPGEKVNVEVVRGGRTQTFELTLGEPPPPTR